MKTRKLKISAMIAVSSLLFSAGFISAQTDTSRVGQPGIEQGTGKEKDVDDRQDTENQKWGNEDDDMNTDTLDFNEQNRTGKDAGIESGTENKDVDLIDDKDSDVDINKDRPEDLKGTDVSNPDVKVENETNVYDMDNNTGGATTTAPAADAENRQWWDDDNEDEFHAGELGLRYMPTFTYLDFDTYQGGEVIRGTVTAGHGVELMGGVNFNRHIGLMAAVGWNEISQNYKDRGLERQVNLSYINIPVLLQINTSKAKPVNLNLVVGPQFGINIGADVDASSSGNTETATATVAVKQGDIGLAYGAGLEFGLNPERTFRLDLGFRGTYGFADISDRQSGDTYTVTFKGARRSYAGYVGLAWAF